MVKEEKKVKRMMYKELKVLIINWLLDHEHEWQRLNECKEAFRPYIYDTDGNYLIGGENVADFIERADALLYYNDWEKVI